MAAKFVNLGDVADIMTGIPGFSNEGEYAFRVIQPTSFSDDGVLNTAEHLGRSDLLSATQLLLPGDILLKRLNPSFVYIVDDRSSGMAASQNLLVVRPGERVYPFFLGFLLEQKEILGQVEHVTGSAAAIKAISAKKLSGISIPLLPMEEQMKIGDLWKLSRVRKQYLKMYLAENDRLVSMLASRILK